MIKFGVITDKILTGIDLTPASFNNRYEISGICFSNSHDPEVEYKDKPGTSPDLSYNSLLNKSDAILFLGDSSFNRDKVSMALKRSRHVFLDYPPDITDDQYNELLKLADEAGVVVNIRNELLNHPYLCEETGYKYQTKHIELEKGFKEARPVTSGLIRMLFSDLQFISFIIGGNIIKWHVNGIRNISNKINFFHIHIEFDNGSTTSVNYNLIPNSRFHKATLYQTDKQIILDLITNSTEVLSAGKEIPEITHYQESSAFKHNVLKEPEIKQNQHNAIRNFLQLLTSDSCKCISFEDSFRSFSRAKEIYLKLEQADGVPV